MKNVEIKGGATAPNVSVLITALCAVILFSVMNAGMFQVALPLLQQHFGLLPAEVSWVVTGYIVIYAIGSLIYGKLADKFAIRKLLLFGVSIFVVGSVLGLVAGWLDWSFGWIIVARVIQSAGASAVPATAMLIPSRFVAAEQRGKALGTISSTVALGTGVGPLISGLITGYFGWPSLFLISIGVVVMMPFLMRELPNESPRGTMIDGWGASGIALAVAGVMLSISLKAPIYLVMSAVGILLAIVVGRKHPMPFLPISIFKQFPQYAQALGGVFFAAATVFSVLIVMPLLLKEHYGFSPQQIGMTMFPSAIIAALMGRYAGAQVDKRGSRVIVQFALVLLLLGYLFLASLSQVNIAFVVLGLLLVQFGFAWAQPALSKQVSVSVSSEKTGIAFGVFTLTTFMSGAIAGTVSTRLLTSWADGPVWDMSGVAMKSEYVWIFGILAVMIGLALIVMSKTIVKNVR